MSDSRAGVSLKVKVFLILNVVLIGLDQATKIWITQNLRLNRDSIDIIDNWLQIVHVQNTGAAGGLLGDYQHRMWVFLGFTVVALGVLISMVREIKADDWRTAGTLGMIFAGAVGNAIDRAHKQSVTDFIRVYTREPALEDFLRRNLGTAEYPSFNVADIAIVVGVVLYALVYWRGYGRPAVEPDKPESGGPTPGAEG